MAGLSRFTDAVKPIMSSWKGANTGGLAVKGMAGGGAVGATYGGLSDNHTALGMGIAGAVAGGGIAREMNGLKAWQGKINSTRAGRIKALDDSINTKSMGGLDTARDIRAKGKYKRQSDLSGADGVGSYLRNRFNTLGG